nr:retrovirus-related Pol polyprotein from transposon TNT 1-94 [Tanacetum cinerariifolium]
MSGAIPPISLPFGASSSNPGSPNAYRVDTMPTTKDHINTTTTENVAQSVVDENLPQLLDSRGGSHVTNVPAFDKKGFTSWKDSDLDVIEDQRTNNEFMADLNAEYYERAFLANQKRFYKRPRKDEGTTQIKAFMAIAEDEPSVGKADARSDKWVNITMKKTCSKVTLDQLLSEQIPGNIVKALSGKGKRKENKPSKEVLFTKANVSTSESAPMITSDSKNDSDIEEPLPPLPKLTGVDPSSAFKSLISLFDLTANMDDLTLNTASKEIKKSNKVSQTYVIKKKTESKHPAVQNLCPNKNALLSTEQLLLTLMEEVKGIKNQLLIPLDTSSSVSQAYSSNTRKQKVRYSKEPGPKVVFGDDSSGDTKGYGLVNCNGITFTRVAYVNGLKHNLISISHLFDDNFKVLFTKTQGTIFNQNDEVVLIAPRRRDVNVIDMSSFNKERNTSFLAKASLRNFSSPCNPEQNDVAEKRNITLIEAARTMLNSAKLPKQFWGEAVNTACYTQTRFIIVKRYGKTAYDVFRGRSLDINYFHVFGYPVYIHNHRDHLEKFDEKADDGFFLGYYLMANAFRNSVTSEEPPAFTIGDDLPADYEPVHTDSADILESGPQDNLLRKSISGDQPAPVISSSAEVILQNLAPQDKWSREKHIELVNIIGESLASIIARSRIRDSEAVSAHECLYVNFLSEIEPKKLTEAFEEEGRVLAMTEELNRFERNKVWTLVPKNYSKTIIRLKWVFRNKMDEEEAVTRIRRDLLLREYSKILGKLLGQLSLTIESQRRNMEDDFCGTFVHDTQVLETSKNNHMEKEIEVSDEGDVGVDVATSQSPQYDRHVSSLPNLQLYANPPDPFVPLGSSCCPKPTQPFKPIKQKLKTTHTLTNTSKFQKPISVRTHTFDRKQKIIDNESGFIAVFGKWRNIGMDCLMIVVYAPQELDSKRSLRNKITSLVNNYNGMSIVLGDFNEDVLIIFLAQLLDINPRSGVSFSWVVCRLCDSRHKGSYVCHYAFFSIMTSSTGSHGWRQLVDTKGESVIPQLPLIGFFILALDDRNVWRSSVDNKKLAWVAWKQVCSSKDCGGLGIGCLLASNLAMLTKWWWRFKSESNSLWHQVITFIFGSHGRLETNIPTPISHLIMYALKTYKDCLISERCIIGGLIDLSSHVRVWRRSLRDVIEKAQFDDLVNILVGFKPTDVRDTWTFSLNSLNTFTVSSMRFAIDSSILVSTIDNVKWNKTLHIKINIHSRRLRKDRLPTRSNLDARGIDLDSLRCPVCINGIASTPHLFIGCRVAAHIWCMIKDWWGWFAP